jgi:hypothetical protein
VKAEIVLDDCRAVLDWIEDARNEQEFRVRWVGLVALLRAVGHVLDKVDGTSDPRLRQAIDKKWQDWHREPDRHRIFWEFIEAERNSILKTYEMGYQQGDVPVVVEATAGPQLFVLHEALFKPLVDGPFAGEDARDVARDAISWWEQQLSSITADANEHGV